MAERLPLHDETRVVLNAPVDAVFDHLDDFHELSAHMEKSSGMMMGSRMAIEMDERQGRAVGSKVRMRGKMLGMTLSLEEVVTERAVPRRKAWETVNADLLVIGMRSLASLHRLRSIGLISIKTLAGGCETILTWAAH